MAMSSGEAMAIRCVNARESFVRCASDAFGLTETEADKLLAVYVKVKAVKLSVAMGRYDLTHGAWWELHVVRRAIASDL